MDKYAIFGHPVKHSLSPIIHEAFAQQAHQTIEYQKIQPPKEAFAPALREFINTGGKGANITTPFKHEAFLLADEKTPRAQQALAASCLLIREDNTLVAENFDGTGFIQDLTHNHRFSINQKRILILGAGGATQGILEPLFDGTPSQITIANRTAKTAIDLASRYQTKGDVAGVGFDTLPSTAFDLIIHATTMGHTDKSPHLPNGLITQSTFCYDLSYGKAAQPFLQTAKQQGAKYCADGLGMLVEHNAALFYWWRQFSPNTKPVIQLLRNQL